VDRLRVLTLNLWGEQAPLERRMEMVVRGLSELTPDVVALQEVREIPGRLDNQAQTLAARAGYQAFVFAPATGWGGGQEGVALLSRFAIGEHARHVLPASTPDETRVLLMARVHTPQGPVHCYATHLNYRLTHGLQREQQVVAIDELVRAQAGAGPQIVMGDFNATPDHDEIRYLRGLCTLAGRRTFYQDAWAVCHPGEPGFTWAQRNPYTEGLAFLGRDRRIDYVWVTAPARDGRGSVVDARIVLAEPDRDGTWASDHFGVLAEIQLTARP